MAGCASELGAATAEQLIKAGAKVTILDLNAEIDAVKEDAIEAHFVMANVCDEAQVAAAIEQAILGPPLADFAYHAMMHRVPLDFLDGLAIDDRAVRAEIGRLTR